VADLLLVSYQHFEGTGQKPAIDERLKTGANGAEVGH
jgi:hypothetical protein